MLHKTKSYTLEFLSFCIYIRVFFILHVCHWHISANLLEFYVHQNALQIKMYELPDMPHVSVLWNTQHSIHITVQILSVIVIFFLELVVCLLDITIFTEKHHAKKALKHIMNKDLLGSASTSHFCFLKPKKKSVLDQVPYNETIVLFPIIFYKSPWFLGSKSFLAFRNEQMVEVGKAKSGANSVFHFDLHMKLH